jgi:hypothetical protein
MKPCTLAWTSWDLVKMLELSVNPRYFPTKGNCPLDTGTNKCLAVNALDFQKPSTV